MAHSLEVRVPLVDVELLRRLAPAVVRQKGASKRILAHSPSLPLPRSVIERRKTGFVTPIQAWLQRDARLQHWRQVPAFAAERCAWARRWAFELAAA
jgi:asparagine synthase (glutamine-hydrolysing)